MQSHHSTNLIMNTLNTQSAGDKIDSNAVKIGRKLNFGSSADVYYGEWGTIKVAVKQLRTDSSSGAEKSFENDQSILRIISLHKEEKYLIKYYGCIEDGIKRSLVLEYMEKGDLCDYILARKDSHLSEINILKLALDIVNGLECLHRYKIIHCDLKCDNILLDKDEHAKLTDFGYAMLKQDVENHDSLQGTPQYVAPELYSSIDSYTPYSEKSDMYAYSIVLYMTAHLQGPYKANLSDESITQLALKNIRPTINNNKCPLFVSNLIKRCWEQDPKLRPDPSDVIIDIEKRMHVM